MNQTIKKRIEEINNGIVPEGYEKTSFGIFPCDWEKDKSLGDICEINPKTEALPNEFIYIDLESVVDGKLIQENVIENAKAPSRAQRVLQKNDIIYQMVRPYQKNNFIFIQDDGSFKYVASTGYAQLRSDNYSFLYQMVNSEYFCTQVLKKCTGTNYPAINSQDLAEVNCAYPKSDREQSRIAEILMQWDKAIELQEKLIEAYQKSKKYYLNKMFPKKGSNVPEIRFPGFTAPWEQRKVNSICEKTYGGGTPSTSDCEFWTGEIPWIQSSDIVEHNVLDVTVRKWISNKAIRSSATQHIPANSIAIITRVGVGKLAFMPFSYTTSQDFLSLSSLRINALFATYALYVKLQNDMNVVQGTSIKGITKDELLAKEIAVPNNPLEQERISALFKGIDNLITLHQQNRDKLLKQRRALQQYLLTGIVRV